jgi:DNA polymerase V
MILEFFKPNSKSKLKAPFFEGGIKAGFPSPATDFQEERISLDKVVLGASPSTKFYARVDGDSMKDAGILHGSIIVVDKAGEPANNKIAVCVVNSEFTLKRLKVEKGLVWLMPENDKFKPLLINDSDSFEIWGIVTHCLNYY